MTPRDPHDADAAVTDGAALPPQASPSHPSRTTETWTWVWTWVWRAAATPATPYWGAATVP